MASQRQKMVEVTPTDYAKGRSSTTRLQGIYGGSPIYEGKVSDDGQTAYYQENVLNGIRETGFGLDGFNTSFIDAPNLEEVETGGGGLPASPFVPNPTSPGEGSTSATDQPEAPEGFGKTPNDQYGSGVGHALSPNVSSEKISQQTLGDYLMGVATKE